MRLLSRGGFTYYRVGLRVYLDDREATNSAGDVFGDGVATPPSSPENGGGYAELLIEPKDLMQERRVVPLSRQEVAELRRLCRAARLFRGPHGGETEDEDIPVRGIEYRDRNRVAIVVTSGNPSFDRKGPRQELLTPLVNLMDVAHEKWRQELRETDKP